MDALPIDTQLWDQQVRVVIQSFSPKLDSAADEIDMSKAIEGLPNAGLALEYVLDTKKTNQVQYFGIELSQQVDCKFGLAEATPGYSANTITDPYRSLSNDLVVPAKVWRDYECTLEPEIAAYYGRQLSWKQTAHWTLNTQLASGLAVESFHTDPTLDVHLNIVPINAQYRTHAGFTAELGIDIAPIAYQNEGLVRLSFGKLF